MIASTARRRWRHRVAFAALSVLLASGPSLAWGPAAPASAASSSWDSKRTEEFSGSSLPKGCGAYTGKYSGGKSAWSGQDADVDDGLLQLKIEKRKVEGRAWATGGVGCWDWAQKYGKWEIRAKVPAGAGIDSYFGLWPSKGGEGAWTGVELLAPGPETAYITNGYGTKAQTARVPGEYSGAFHTYAIEWAPTWVRITMDGDELFFSPNSYNGMRWPALVVSSGDALTGVPGASTKLPAYFQIDRIKTFSYTGVPPTSRSDTAASRSRVAGTPAAVPGAVPTDAAKAPATSPAASAGSAGSAGSAAATTEPAVETVASPALAGGIWPWLLGGSLIAAAAIGMLNYPRHRAHQQQVKQARERHPTGAGRR